MACGLVQQLVSQSGWWESVLETLAGHQLELVCEMGQPVEQEFV